MILCCKVLFAHLETCPFTSCYNLELKFLLWSHAVYVCFWHFNFLNNWPVLTKFVLCQWMPH
jgi:hypothetical protein